MLTNDMSFDPKDNPLKGVKVEIPDMPLARAFNAMLADLGFKVQDPQIEAATRLSNQLNKGNRNPF